MATSFGISQRGAEQRNELSARSVQSGLDGADRHAFDSGEGLERLLVNLSEEKHSPLLVGESGNCRLERLGQLPLLNEPVGTRSRIGDRCRMLHRHQG